MKRAVVRAYRRVQGAHPRRPKSRHSLWLDLACDLLLALAATGLLGGVAVLLWGLATGARLSQLLAGAGLFVLGAALLLAWERIAWEPFVEALSEQISELT